jgi:3'-phosphoadenosine 5'-phosphosulfate sulfotransferase (PAPS reductase)/FAD synthetase
MISGVSTEQKLAYLKQWQSLPLEIKVEMSKRRITEWYEQNEGKVYVSFSGGKDSTTLLHLVRSLYPDVVAVFVDTGLEYPEIREFVKTIKNVEWVRPRKTFKEVISEYGYPIISKEVSMAISRYRGTKHEVQKELRKNGGLNPNTNRMQTTGVIPKKYHYLIDAPFKISERCCDWLKKNPLKEYGKRSGTFPYIGVMACDSAARKRNFAQHGCNTVSNTTPQSRPLMFWLEDDVWEYLRSNHVAYCPLYDNGVHRTGCVFCMFGIIKDAGQGENRFELLERSHPNLHKYCISTLGLGKILGYLGVQYGTTYE